MDVSKKRKTDENGLTTEDDSQTLTLTPDDARKLVEPFTKDQLLTLLTPAITRYSDILSSARSLADSDSTRRKLFVRGLSPETTTDSLKSIYSTYGDIEEAVVISDKGTGKSKGYGFVTYRHVDGALRALREPSKRIDGRMTVTHLASLGKSNNNEEVANRKVYVGNVPYELSAVRLLEFFEGFGEVEEGPLGFDRVGGSGKARGFAFFVYKSEESARAALFEQVKLIDGHQVVCKLADDGKKSKFVGPTGVNQINHGFNGGYQSYGPGPNGGGYNVGPPAPVVPQYNNSGQFAPSYRMPPPPPVSSMGMTMPPPMSGYGQEGSGGYVSQNVGQVAQPQGPPGPMYQRMPPPYY